MDIFGLILFFIIIYFILKYYLFYNTYTHGVVEQYNREIKEYIESKLQLTDSEKQNFNFNITEMQEYSYNFKSIKATILSTEDEETLYRLYLGNYKNFNKNGK